MSDSANAFIERSNQRWKQLKDADALAKQRGKLVGRYVTHQYADSHAVYVITAHAGKSATVEWVDIDDAWVLPAWGKKAKIPLSKVHQLIHNREFYENLHSTGIDWWQRRTVGETVHYDYGFGCWVRGVIVREGGENTMKPTALVGPWREHSLWMRGQTGTLRPGTYTKMVQEGETFQPNAANMFENRGAGRGDSDPTKLPAIDLTPPEMSDDAKKLANLMTIRQEVLDILKPELAGSDAEAAVRMEEALIQATVLLTHKFEGR